MKAAISAIVGVGLSELSRSEIGTARDLAIEAILAAVADSGLPIAAIDGLLISKSPSAELRSLPLHLRNDLALGPLKLLAAVEGEGTSAVQAVQLATQAVGSGTASAVACVFADARIAAGAGGAAGYSRAMELTGIDGWEQDQGLSGAVGAYALAAQRYLTQTGQTETDLGAYAVACRRWAMLHPQAFLREPLTLEQHAASRTIASPLRLLDCAYPINGAAAVIVVAAKDARATAEPPVYVLGMGQGHVGGPEPVIGAGLAAASALSMAELDIRDIAMVQHYDPFSSVGLQLLEAYGLCAPGAAGDLVRGGHTSPGGRLPVNTGGGHLSGFYLQGMTPLVEAVAQARGQAGQRQAATGPILVGGLGGCLEYHACLVVHGPRCG